MSIQHAVIYHQPGMYAGWPANQGMWCWGDEILVGFVLGHHAKYREHWRFGHPIDVTKEMRHVYCRSADGGQTWDDPVDGTEIGRTSYSCDHTLKDAIPPRMLDSPILALVGNGFAASFVRETNHTGPTHWYYSLDRGRW